MIGLLLVLPQTLVLRCTSQVQGVRGRRDGERAPAPFVWLPEVMDMQGRAWAPTFSRADLLGTEHVQTLPRLPECWLSQSSTFLLHQRGGDLPGWQRSWEEKGVLVYCVAPGSFLGVQLTGFSVGIHWPVLTPAEHSRSCLILFSLAVRPYL